MMQHFVWSQGDGWHHATEELSRFYEAVAGRDAPQSAVPSTFTEMIGAQPPQSIQDVLSGYLETASTLGRRTCELHLALSSDTQDAAFAPEPFTKDDLTAVSIDAAAQAQKALSALQNTAGLPEDVAAASRELLRARPTIMDIIHGGPSLEFTASKIRIHGDYHLGQVLWCEGDFVILDFEGEPARTIAERRQKQSPLKDVAGMLRSFGYAAYAGLFAHTESRRSEFDRMEVWARVWQLWTSAAFLRAYFGCAGRALFVPSDPAQRDALLRLFVLDKALYELNYELNNRPDWLRIPLRGVLGLLTVE
jgi:maltose alpha-D-glucosyltransferase/alpha-amylase